MRKILLALAASGAWLTVASGANAAPAGADDAATIRALEEEWGQTFLTGNHRPLDRILAPEFKLMRAGKRGPGFTPRSEWFANLKSFKFDQFNIKVVDVVVAANTAIATVEGDWKVSMAGGGSRDERFILSDTWVKRNGRWAVVFRHSTPIPRQ